jgi:hypothetical protein
MASINGGNEGGLDAAVFLFRWRHRATVEAARGRPAAAPCALGFGAGGRRKVAAWAMRVGWAGRKAEVQWEGEGKSASKKKTGPKVTGKILFRIKFDF